MDPKRSSSVHHYKKNRKCYNCIEKYLKANVTHVYINHNKSLCHNMNQNYISITHVDLFVYYLYWKKKDTDT